MSSPNRRPICSPPSIDGENGDLQPGSQLINEAIKRILLDIVVRGHGDRLIGRWSREPQLQQFLDQIPYMLDRINQLHLACTRRELFDQDHVHHHHRHHHNRVSPNRLGQSSLHDFVTLIGDEHHWLVRTRDPLGLTPLHKAVLFNNRPIIEYILDRYPDELAAPSSEARAGANRKLRPTSSSRLVDAQDKYGRTALHYAAAASRPSDSKLHDTQLAAQCHIYQFLLTKGASVQLLDFRGKRATHYLRHPNQLRAKSIIHLSNKLNANYQANVLTKTLRATIDRRPLDNRTTHHREGGGQREDGLSLDGESSAPELELESQQPKQMRESMSVSCHDLSDLKAPQKETQTISGAGKIYKTTSSSSLSGPALGSNATGTNMNDQSLIDHELATRQSSASPIDSLASSESAAREETLRAALKQLRADRCTKLVVDPKTKLTILRCLSEGNVDKVNEILVEGHGEFLVQEAPVACWNQACRRYISKVVPELLRKVDQLHELIAVNKLSEICALLAEKPILARIKRPYHRASLGSIHLAVHLGRRSILKLLVKRFPELVNQRDSLGATCLHWAAKSLKNESLYCWLLEHFGAQLEHVRDIKGRTAAENRQLTIRHSSFELFRLSTPLDSERAQNDGPVSHSRQQQLRHVSARNLIKHSQEQADGLQIGGHRSPMSTRTRVNSRNALPNKPEASKGKSVEAVGGSSGLPASDKGDTSVSSLNSTGADKVASAQLSLPDRQIRSVRQDSAANKLDLTDASDLRFSDTCQGLEVRVEAKNPLDYEGEKHLIGTVKDETQASGFLSEMVKLDQEDLRKDSCECHELEAPISVRSMRNLEASILQCIRENKFDKLEHLILAGFGKQVLRLCENLSISAPTTVNKSLGEEMRNFLRHQVPDYMRNIELIHKTIHECFAYQNQDNKISGKEETEKESDDLDRQTNFNECFHKLCNLMMAREGSLIMCRDQFGASPLHIAIMRCDKRLIDYLLRRQPEAASGPDYDGRNALHYAAIVLSAARIHAPIRVTTRVEFEEGSRYWVVDQPTAEATYLALCSRYSDLVSSSDKYGLTCDALLARGSENKHSPIPEDALGQAIHSPDVLINCCGDYATLLSRYDYGILTGNGVRTPHDLEGRVVRAQTTRSAPHSANMQNNSRLSQLRRQNKSYDQLTDDRGDQYDDLFNQLEGELIVPASSIPLDAAQVTQVAPKPTVGCTMTFPPPSPGATVGDRSSSARKSPRRKKGENLNLGKSPTFVVGLETPMRHHHHHHHHQHKRYLRRPPNSCGGGRSSIIGGVIVPTIIHNDKMDEIETYDIIYRQQPTNQQILSKSSSSPSSSSSSLSDGRDEKEPFRSDSRQSSKNSKRTGLASSSNSSSEEDDDEEDRVERLSNEFEDRVRREKSELRAKVDQIMNEIKMGAKSSRSSRFLTSPTNLDRPQEDDTEGVLIVDTAEVNGEPLEAKNLQARPPRRENLPSHRGSVSSSGHSSCSNSSSSLSATTGSEQDKANFSGRSCNSVGSSSGTTSCSSASSTATSSSRSSSTLRSSPVPKLALLGELRQEQQDTQAKAHSGSNRRQPILQTTHIADLSSQLVSKNTYGQTYLHFIASRAQSASQLYKVLEHGSHLIGERDIFYRTARDVAVQFNLPQNVQVLDKFIIDLFIAGNTRLLRLLLNQGYSPLIHVSDPDGNDIMLILKLLKLDRMIHMLLQMADFQRWRDELHTFIRHGYSAGVSELIKKHKDLIRAKSAHSRTSLHLAVLFDRPEMVTELLDADPSSAVATDNMDRTALHYTYGLNLKNVEEIRNKLLACGASAEARDVKMRTPKYYYIFKREIEELKRIELELN